MNIYLGLMSGTSMDGIDAALVDLDTHQLLHGITYPYEPQVKHAVMELITQPTIRLEYFMQTHRQVGELFAQAAMELLHQARCSAQEVQALGSHGQTIVHAPQAHPAYTLQIGCGHTIAARTRITTVADFRTRDVVLGGQGAPLAPLYHQQLFADQSRPYAVLNIGGISNLSCFLDPDQCFGYDVGPGNQLLDAWIQRCLGHSFDRNGAWGASGQVIPSLVDALMQDPYFQQPYPKSLDKSYFSLDKLLNIITPSMKPEDVQASLVAVTVNAIVQAMSQWPHMTQLWVCGGGVHHQDLMNQLQQRLQPIPVQSTQSLGYHPDFIEAMMCAWLAQQCIQHQSLPLSSITGGQPTILGAVYFVHR
jgi:anhydro-N-acetylmuramic acid kinase